MSLIGLESEGAKVGDMQYVNLDSGSLHPEQVKDEGKVRGTLGYKYSPG